MSHARPVAQRIFLAVFAFVASLASPTAASAPLDDGYCHLPRWAPAGTAPFDALGVAVAFDGTVAAVAAPGGDAVATFSRVGGQWMPGDRLMAPPTSAGGFGTSLALLGDHLVVGDPSDTTLGADAGAAHVYVRSGDNWAWSQTLLDDTGVADDRFGTALTITPAWIVVGAPGDDEVGRVHLFRAQPAGFLWTGSIHQFGTGMLPEAFGAAVAMQGDWLLVGDPLDDSVAVDGGSVSLYAVYDIFSLYEDVFVPATLQAGDGFGASLHFADDRIVIGARGDDELGVDAGAAYVLAFDATADPELSLVQRITSTGGGPADLFGSSVALDGDRLVVGAPGKETVGAPGGRAAVHRREPGVVPETWSLEVEVSPGDGLAGDLFGTAVGLAGGHLLIGAPAADAVGDDSGAAYLVSLSSQSLPGGECPCDVLASVTAFGTGKPGSAGVPQLAFDHPPVIGEVSSLRLSDAWPGATPWLFWGPSSVEVPFDGGALYVDDFHLFVMPPVDGAGIAEVALAVPADIMLCGLQLTLQVMLVDPGAAGAFQTAQSNGLEMVLGY